MKTLLLCILVSCSYTTLFAQVKIITSDEAKAQGINIDQLDTKYEDQKKPTKNNQENLKFYREFSLKINQLGKAIGNKKDKGVIWSKFYINKSGHFDYCIYNVVEGNLPTATLQRFKDSLQVFLNNYKFGNQLSSNDSFNQAIYIGVVRQTIKADSLITELEDAETTTRPDTVKTLALHQLDLEHVPDIIYKFKEMEMLNLSGNLFKTVDIDLAKLPKLKHLWLNNNQINNDGLHLTANKTLKILNLQNNSFTDIPKAVQNCKKLASLWLGHNKLTNLNNQSFSQLKTLKDLNFYSAQLTSLPAGISKLRRLEIIDLYYNNLTTLPKTFGRLKKLHQAALSHNELSVLPKTFGKLRRLEKFYAHHNKLSDLPTNFKKLRRLQTFDVGYNQFSIFPSQVRFLSNLEEIDASYNNLSEVPAMIIEMPHLQKVFLRANPFTEDAALLNRSKVILEALTENKIEVYY